MTEVYPLEIQIRTVLKDHAHLVYDSFTLAADNDLYQSGMTSLSSVNVMLALEETFDVEFPDHMLSKKVFGSIIGIRDALLELKAA
jgi:acyl carrier protein